MKTIKNSLIKSLVNFVYGGNAYSRRADNIQDHIIKEYLAELPYFFNVETIRKDFAGNFLKDSNLTVKQGYCRTIDNLISNDATLKKELKNDISLYNKCKLGPNKNKMVNFIDALRNPNSTYASLTNRLNNEKFIDSLSLYASLEKLDNKFTKIINPVKLICAYIHTKIVLNHELENKRSKGEDTSSIEKEISFVTETLAPTLQNIVYDELYSYKNLKMSEIENSVYDTLSYVFTNSNLIKSYFSGTRIYMDLYDNSPDIKDIPGLDKLRSIVFNGYTQRVFSKQVIENSEKLGNNICDLISNINVIQSGEKAGELDDNSASNLYRALSLIKDRVAQYDSNNSKEKISYTTYLTFAILQSQLGQLDYANQIATIISDPLIQSYHLITTNDLDKYAHLAIDIAKDIAKESGKLDKNFDNYLNGLKKSLENKDQKDNNLKGSKKDQKEINPGKNSDIVSARNNGIKTLQQLVNVALEDNEFSLRAYSEIQKQLEKLENENDELVRLAREKDTIDKKVADLSDNKKKLDARIVTLKGQLTKNKNEILKSFFNDKFIAEAHEKINKLIISKKRKFTKAELEFKDDLSKLKTINSEIKQIEANFKKYADLTALNSANNTRKVDVARNNLKVSILNKNEIEARIKTNIEKIAQTQSLLMKASEGNIESLNRRLQIANSHINEISTAIKKVIKSNPTLDLRNKAICEDQRSSLVIYLGYIKSQVKKDKSKYLPEQHKVEEKIAIYDEQLKNYENLGHYAQIKQNVRKEIEEIKQLDFAQLEAEMKALQSENDYLAKLQAENTKDIRENTVRLDDANEYALRSTPAKEYISNMSFDKESEQLRLDNLLKEKEGLIKKIKNYFYSEQLRALLNETKVGTFDKFFDLMDQFDKLIKQNNELSENIAQIVTTQNELNNKLSQQQGNVESIKNEIIAKLDNMLAQKHGLWLVENDIKNSERPIKKNSEALQKENSALLASQKEHDKKLEKFLEKYQSALRSGDAKIAEIAYKSSDYAEIETIMKQIKQHQDRINKLNTKLEDAKKAKLSLEQKRNAIIKMINYDKKSMIDKINRVDLMSIKAENASTIQILNNNKTSYLTMAHELAKLAAGLSKKDSVISEDLIDRYTLDSDKYSHEYTRLEIYNALLEIAKANYSKEVIGEIKEETHKNVVDGMLEILKNTEKYVLSDDLQAIINSDSLQKLVPITQAVKRAEVNAKAREQKEKTKKEKTAKEQPKVKKEEEKGSDDGRSI